MNIKFFDAVSAQQNNAPKEVKTYRIDPVVYEAAERKCRQKHNVGVASIIEPLLKSYFKIDEAKENTSDSTE